MSGRTWWDDAELVLLSTGDIALAEQFALWCQSVHEGFYATLGISPENLAEPQPQEDT